MISKLCMFCKLRQCNHLKTFRNYLFALDLQVENFSKMFLCNVKSNPKEYPAFTFSNGDLLNARLNGHCEARSYKRKKHRKIKTYRKCV